jgi:uncharacterized repeat protein (TIGR03803 family)
MVGSEGTLGVITEITLRLAGIPEAIAAGVCPFPSVEAACNTAIATIQAGIPVARIELLDALQVKACNAYSKLTRATDGFLYGTTAFGGALNQGTVFKIREDGSEYLTIASFGATPGDGLRAYQGLSLGARGILYGTTTAGGTNNTGTIFKILSDGSAYQTIYHFATNQSIAADMFLNSQGELYGSLLDPQGTGNGSLFKLVFPGIRALGTAANGFNLELSGVSGSSYTVQMSEDLLTWRPWLTTNLPAASIQLLDPNPRPGHRFYRAQ